MLSKWKKLLIPILILFAVGCSKQKFENLVTLPGDTYRMEESKKGDMNNKMIHQKVFKTGLTKLEAFKFFSSQKFEGYKTVLKSDENLVEYQKIGGSINTILMYSVRISDSKKGSSFVVQRLGMNK